MPPKILRNILRYYRCYHIIHSIIRGCEIVFVSNNPLVSLLRINLSSTCFFPSAKRHSKQLKSSETNPLKDGKIAKL